MTQPKYPVGTLLRHRASGEKVLVVAAQYSDGFETRYDIEAGIKKFGQFCEDALDLRYERVLEDPQEVFSPPAWHAAGFRMDAPVKIDPKSPVVEITCRTCKQTYEWIPGEGDPFCPRCEPDYPLTATPPDA